MKKTRRIEITRYSRRVTLGEGHNPVISDQPIEITSESQDGMSPVAEEICKLLMRVNAQRSSHQGLRLRDLFKRRR